MTAKVPYFDLCAKRKLSSPQALDELSEEAGLAA